MSYTRVIPRDLFNESKLLKCLGQLALIAHDGHDGKRQAPIMGVEFRDDVDGGFIIEQRQECGGLFVANLKFTVGLMEVDVFTAYNSKSPYPLLFDSVEGEGDVFNDDGTLTDAFHNLRS